MSQPRDFPIGVVVTLTVGTADRIFCTLAELYDALGYMLADLPMSDQIDEFLDRARPSVAQQHPALADVKPPRRGSSDTTILKWLADLEAQHGTQLSLTPVKATP